MLLPLVFFRDPATTQIYTLSLHDALPISERRRETVADAEETGADQHDAVAEPLVRYLAGEDVGEGIGRKARSEEHTSELQSQSNLVCRLLLEKKKKRYHVNTTLYQLQTQE